MRVGSLFSGIGGLDLGLERAGMTVVWQSEIDPYASRVLAKHWPSVPNLGDVTSIEWSTVEPVDLICGGYPCQPFSLAGSRQGTSDRRHLWPHFANAIRVLRPRYALLENVPGHLSMGFDGVLADLAACGFDAEWDLLPAAAVGAPHLRYRLIVVAYPQGERRPDGPGLFGGAPLLRAVARADGRGEHGDSPAGGAELRRPPPERETDVADPARSGRDERRHGNRESEGRLPLAARGGRRVVGDTDRASEDAHAAAGSPRDHLGESGWWAVEPDVARVAHGIPSGMDRRRALGNAVVPQVAEYVGRLIMEAAA